MKGKVERLMPQKQDNKPGQAGAGHAASDSERGQANYPFQNKAMDRCTAIRQKLAGGIAQLAEHELCKLGVTGSNPVASTSQHSKRGESGGCHA